MIDEVVGQLITYAFSGGAAYSTMTIVVGFALFRFFDITKPFFIRRLERFPGGAGVMADDVSAGLFALFVLTILQRNFGI